MPAHYDLFDYQDYWQGRDYEHQSEAIALTALLKKTKLIQADTIEIGAGFGRLTQLYASYSRKITLLEPSRKNISQAKNYLDFNHLPPMKFVCAKAQRLPFANEIFDLAIMVRVLHHIPDPSPAISQVSRSLKIGGFAILEFANKLHLKNIIQQLIVGNFSYLKNLTPEEKRSPENIHQNTIPFVNHHPRYILSLAAKYHLYPVASLSVSNLRLNLLKKLLPPKLLLATESKIQTISQITHLYFGPSIFLLLQKKAL